jgi:hypothetical protein
MPETDRPASPETATWRLRERIIAAHRLARAGGIKRPAVLALDLRDASARALAAIDFPRAEITVRLAEAERLSKVAWIFIGVPHEEFVARLAALGWIVPPANDAPGRRIATITAGEIGVFDLRSILRP